jgi:hypothetical protein
MNSHNPFGDLAIVGECEEPGYNMACEASECLVYLSSPIPYDRILPVPPA